MIGIYGGDEEGGEVAGGLLGMKVRAGGRRISVGNRKEMDKLLVSELVDLVRCETKHLVDVLQSVGITAKRQIR